MARKMIMLICMNKKGKSRKIIAATHKLTNDPNFSSGSFKPNLICSFLDVSSLFLFRMGYKITDTGEDHIFNQIEC